MAGALHSAESVMHYTPVDIVDRARASVSERFKLDPASDAFGNMVVNAETFYDKEGLVRPWYGPLFVNPPGRSDDNPGGASAWWHKLVAEWEASGKSWSAIFVGFSLEILQTCQSKNYRHPLSFPTCIPKQRIRFDVNIRALYNDMSSAPPITDSAKANAFATKFAKVEAAMKRGERRYPGNSPTHGNFITCVTDNGVIARRFYGAFATLGACH